MRSIHPALIRLGDRPLAVAPRALDGLLAAGPRLDARPAMFPARDAPPMASHAVTDAGIAVVPILGPLMTRGDWLTALFGATDYGVIGSAVEAAFAEPSARAVLLEVDSPGGEIGGLFDLVDHLTSLREAAQKPLWAVASESALSAAYAIASVADRLYVTRTAEVGSIGVVAIHVDESAADAMAGLKWTLIHAGARKIDANSHESLSGPALADIQADVDALHDEFVDLVAGHRGMTPEAVRATEAAIYRGRRGIAAGFADRLGTVERALDDLASELDAAGRRLTTPRSEPPARNRSVASTKPGGAPTTPRPQRRMAMITTETDTPAGEVPDRQPDRDANAAPEPAPVPVPDRASAPPAASPEPGALRAEYADIAAVAAQAGRLGIAVDAAEAMRTGVRPDALRRSVLDALAARTEAASVVTAAPTPGSGSGAGAESPIVRRARQRASAAQA